MNSANSSSAFTKPIERLQLAFMAVLDRRWMWVEIVVITLGALALGLYFHRDSAFLIGGEFPWLWLAPMLVALRYGVVAGIASTLMLIAAWQLLGYQDGASFPEQYFFGGLILVMLSGQYSEAWGVRLRRAEEANRYLDERLSRITLRHLLLRLSHDRIEQEMLTKPVTLRDALTALRKLASAENDSRMPAAASLLQLLTQNCQLESAAIFASSPRGRSYARTCEIGSPPDLHATDPLLAHALRHKSLSHLLTDGLADEALPSPFLVVAPILASDGQMLGVLAVDRMPFLALNEDNLQMLSVMLGYYADCVVESDATRQFAGHFPETAADFAAEFSRMLRLQRNYDIDSHVVVLSFGNDEKGRQALAQHELIKRSLDVSWHMEAGGRTAIVTLMPLASEAAVQEYLLRIETRLKEYMRVGRGERSLTPAVISLAGRDPMASLTRAINGAST